MTNKHGGNEAEHEGVCCPLGTAGPLQSTRGVPQKKKPNEQKEKRGLSSLLQLLLREPSLPAYALIG